jgi:hypothetical protein
VDRREGRLVVLKDDSGKIYDVPAAVLPQPCRLAGAVLEVPLDGSTPRWTGARRADWDGGLGTADWGRRTEKGGLRTADWKGGLERRTGRADWKSGLEKRTGKADAFGPPSSVRRSQSAFPVAPLYRPVP